MKRPLCFSSPMKTTQSHWIPAFAGMTAKKTPVEKFIDL
jgi:hypothetical protein